MALINCPECRKEVSDTAEQCIHCGCVLHPEIQVKSKRKRLVLVWLIISVLILAGGGSMLWMRSKASTAFVSSKTAYLKINGAASICEQAMSDIYDAWMWGIYEWDDMSTFEERAYELQNEVSIDLQAGAGENTPGDYLLGAALFSLDSEWQSCVALVIDSYEAAGLYQEAETLMNEAQQALKSVSESDSDYQHYPMLKQYYSKVSAMLEFVKSPTGSFEQLATTKNNYSNDILNFQGDLSFVFEE